MADDDLAWVSEYKEEAKKKDGFTRATKQKSLREQEQRDISWTPPTHLPEPPEIPGRVHRWIRVSLLGNADDGNVSYRLREGWTPVSADDEEYAELAKSLNFRGRISGKNIETGGQMLCWADADLMKARERFFQNKAVNQVETVNKRLQGQNDPNVGLRFSIEELKHEKKRTL